MSTRKSEDPDTGKTASFDPANRAGYVGTMRNAGYVEDPAFTADPGNGYWCANCQYFRAQEPRSPTGAWCEKYGFPDRAHGCCDGWQKK